MVQMHETDKTSRVCAYKCRWIVKCVCSIMRYLNFTVSLRTSENLWAILIFVLPLNISLKACFPYYDIIDQVLCTFDKTITTYFDLHNYSLYILNLLHARKENVMLKVLFEDTNWACIVIVRLKLKVRLLLPKKERQKGVLSCNRN